MTRINRHPPLRGRRAARRQRRCFIRDLTDGQAVETIFLVRERSLAQKRNGEDFLRLTLCDCTGTLSAVAWDGVASIHEIAAARHRARVRGRYEVYERYGPQLVVKAASLARGRRLPARPTWWTARPSSAEQMEADLRSLIETVRNPWLRRLLDALYGEQLRGRGSASAALRPRSSTTRPTCTGCSSTRCPWARP